MKNMHEFKVLTKEEVMEGRSSAYEFIDFDKQEPTLEEFIKRQLSLGKYQDQESAIKYSILSGAKWQQERSYSKEDMKEAFIQGHSYCRCISDNYYESKEGFEEWFEQYKKK